MKTMSTRTEMSSGGEGGKVNLRGESDIMLMMEKSNYVSNGFQDQQHKKRNPFPIMNNNRYEGNLCH